MNFFTGVFMDFAYFLGTRIYRTPSSCCFRSSQRSTYLLGKYYTREYLNVKIPHLKLFQGEYLFSGGSTYLLVNEYWGNSCFPASRFPVNNIYLFIFISSLFRVDLHLAYRKPMNANNNTAYISTNKLPSNNDSNKTEYLIVRQNKHVANRFCIT